jgi:LCP family protein required for cell wall assembly
MSEQKSRKPGQGRAYTGETIDISQRKSGKSAQPPKLPEVPPVISHRRSYQNPPPSQRREEAAQEGKPARHAADKDEKKKKAKTARPATQRSQQKAIPQTERARPSLLQRIKRTLRTVALLLLLLLLLVTGALWWQAHGVAEAVVVRDVRNNPSLATPLVGGVTVLLIGVDERTGHPEEGVRSDTLILARVNGPGRWVNMLSIPRDTEVDIPGVGPTKIAVAYGQGYARAEELYGTGTSAQQGGMGLAAQTVEKFLASHGRSIRVDYTAQVNFEGFVGVVDALGGVTIDVPRYIVDYAYPTADFGVTTVEFQPGPQHMDGAHALMYARTRHADSDFGRSERQQQVIRAIMAELQARGWTGRLAAMPALLEGVKGQEGAAQPVLTTMPFDRPDMLLGLALLASGLNSDSIGRVQISPEFVEVFENPSTGNLTWDSADVRAQVDTWMRRPQPPAPESQISYRNR